ncbi:MAG: HAMP domain-containing sensor histidine kinase [Bacteroidales bacterium]
MKKRIIVSFAILLGITTVMLVITIFQLYKEAEKVQRSIFVNEVLDAGDNIINKIDAVLKNDTLAIQHNVENNKDSSQTVFSKLSKKFLLDSVSMRPIGVVKTTINFKESNATIVQHDTILFDTTYRNIFPFLNTLWTPDFDFNSEEISKKKKKNFTKRKSIDLIEMDSNTIALLNPEYLNRIIKASLTENNITADYDFCLYNAFTTKFVVSPFEIEPEKILKSEYVFSLKHSEKFIAPHYLILYFPGERGIYFQRMSTISMLIICFLVIIIFVTGFTLLSLYRQKKISDVKNDFINNMTHEFKTPIATISLACEAMSDKSVIEDSAIKAAYVSIIKDENDRLKKMVTNILQLAQLKKGQLQMDIELFDIHELIKRITESLSLQILSNKGNLILHLDASCSKIFGDKSHIENVIINLIENAIKYSENSPKIEIETQNDKKHLILLVKDHGIGIAKRNRKKIFQEFYRVSKGNIHNTKGYGMGLGYVKKIISLHGGSITVKSELNTGSIFIIYLPIKK